MLFCLMDECVVLKYLQFYTVEFSTKDLNFMEKSLKQSLYYTTCLNLKNALNLISDCRYCTCSA